jgi:hypothetical protein
MEAISRVKAKLQQLREVDTGFRVPGAKAHRYRMNACLRERDIAEFEARHAIRLPEDYRQFLFAIGDGGAGQDEGLLSLPREGPEEELLLGQPFPLSTEKARRILFRQRPAFVRHPIPGCFVLSRDPHLAYEVLLVVAGEQRGTVWYEVDTPESGLVPAVEPEGGQVSFLGWYEGWLDQWLAPGAIEPARKRPGK